MRHLIIHLEGPLMSFGGEVIDNYGYVQSYPAKSMLVGMLANALGWKRTQCETIQTLQDRVVFAARIDRECAGGTPMTDFQSVAISNRDRAWTTRGVPEGRYGGSYTTGLRYRDYLVDACVTVALRLQPEDGCPNLEELAHALNEPQRTLFIGRKPCLPSAPLFSGFAHGDTALVALLGVPAESDAPAPLRIFWPDGEGVETISPTRSMHVTDERNWLSGLHGGGRMIHEGVTG